MTEIFGLKTNAPGGGQITMEKGNNANPGSWKLLRRFLFSKRLEGAGWVCFNSGSWKLLRKFPVPPGQVDARENRHPGVGAISFGGMGMDGYATPAGVGVFYWRLVFYRYVTSTRWMGWVVIFIMVIVLIGVIVPYRYSQVILVLLKEVKLVVLFII